MTMRKTELARELLKAVRRDDRAFVDSACAQPVSDQAYAVMRAKVAEIFTIT